MKIVLAVAATGEALTGLALLVVPETVIRLLLGAEISGAAIPLARVAGMSLIALGAACWPNGEMKRALGGMLIYSLTVMLYFLFLGFDGHWAGPLLWPAVAVHAILTLLLTRALFRERE